MGDTNVWDVDEAGGRIRERRREGLAPKQHAFDHVFGPSTPTALVYDKVAVPIVDAALGGHNATVFAYGQTSSGKTHTMMGTPDEPGIVILAVHDIFSAIAAAAGSGEREYEVRCSYLELFNEELNDLFNPSGPALRIVEAPEGGVAVQHSSEEIVQSPERVLELLTIGEANRAVSMTAMNARSSRSHTMFSITIESWRAGGLEDDGSQVSTLTLVDLAGSERVSKSGATGQRMKETGRINTSLLTLGTVISKLVSGADHVPYRDSKLTRLLSPSLGGDACTALVATVSPAGWNKGETRSTLAFATRAMRVVNTARAPTAVGAEALLAKYRREITALRAALLEARGTGQVTVGDESLTPAQLLQRFQASSAQAAEAAGQALGAEAASRQQAEAAVDSLLQLLFVASHGVADLPRSPRLVSLLAEVAAGTCSAPRALRTIFQHIPDLKQQLERMRHAQAAAGGDGKHLRSASSPASDGGPERPEHPFTPQVYSDRLLALLAEQTSLKKQLDEVNAALEESRAATRAAQQALTRAQADADAARNAQADMATHLAAAASEREGMQAALQRSKQALSAATADRDEASTAARAAADQLRGEKAALEQRLQEAQASARSLRGQLEDAKAAMTTLRHEAEERGQALDTAQAAVDDLEGKLRQSQGELEAARRRAAQAEEANEMTQQELEASRSSTQRLRQQHAQEVEGVTAACDKRVAEASGDLDACRAELRAALAACTSTKGDLDISASELRSARARLAQVQGELEAQSQAKAAAEESLSSAQAEASGLRVELAQTRHAIAALEAEVDQLKADGAQSRAARKEVQGLKEAAQAEAQRLRLALADTQQQVQRLQEAKDSLEEELTSANTQTSDLLGTLSQQREEVQSSESKQGRLEAELQALREQLQRAQHRATAAEQADEQHLGQLHAAREALSQAKAQHDHQSAAASQEVAALRDECALLRRRLQTASRELQAAQEEHAPCPGRLEELRQQLRQAAAHSAEAQDEREQLQDKLRLCTNDLHAAKEELAASQLRLERVATEEAVYRRRAEVAEGELHASRGLVADARTAMLRMEEQVAAAEEKCTIMRLSVLKAENAGAQSAFAELEEELAAARGRLGEAGSGAPRTPAALAAARQTSPGSASVISETSLSPLTPVTTPGPLGRTVVTTPMSLSRSPMPTETSPWQVGSTESPPVVNVQL